MKPIGRARFRPARRFKDVFRHGNNAFRRGILRRESPPPLPSPWSVPPLWCPPHFRTDRRLLDWRERPGAAATATIRSGKGARFMSALANRVSRASSQTHLCALARGNRGLLRKVKCLPPPGICRGRLDRVAVERVGEQRRQDHRPPSRTKIVGNTRAAPKFGLHIDAQCFAEARRDRAREVFE
jgi:hypothetical protein